MLTSLETPDLNKPESICPSRARCIQRWSSEGARAWATIQRKPLYLSSRPHPVLRRESWFGSNGKCAGYNLKGVSALLKSQSAFRRGIVAATIQHYTERFACITTMRACQILNAIGSGNDVFQWHNTACNTVTHHTPNKVVRIENWCQVYTYYANLVSPIDFTGGPPDKWTTYYGSLFTFLLDRIAVVVLFDGLGALDGVIAPNERYSKFA